MANIKNVNLNGTNYTIVDSTAVHTVDAILSTSSTNPVQNKVITAEVNKKPTFIDLGEKSFLTTAGLYAANITAQESLSLSGSHDGIKITTASTSTYNPSGTIYAFKTGSATINGVNCNLYAGAMAESDFDSRTFTIAVPVNAPSGGTCYIKEEPEGSDGPFYVAGSGSIAAVTTSPYYSSRWKGTNNKIASLYTGLCIYYKIDVAGNGSYGTVLDINGLGEHPVCANVNTYISTRYAVNCIIPLVYDADQTATAYINSASTSTITGVWKMADYDSTIVYRLEQYYTQPKVYKTSVTGQTSASLYRYQLVFSKKDGTVIPGNGVSNAATTYTKAQNTESFDPFGPIYYYQSTSTVSPDEAIAANQLYKVFLADMRYSFNVKSDGTAGTQALTVNKPVYLKALYDYSTGECNFTQNGSTPTYLDSLVQDLPTTDPNTNVAPGKSYIYIFLGYAYDKYRIDLQDNHQVYFWKDGKMTPFTGEQASVTEGAVFSIRALKCGGNNMKKPTIVGGTVAWNQLCQNGDFANTTIWNKSRCDLTVSGNIGTFTCNSNAYATWGFYQIIPAVIGHKCLVLCSLQGNATKQPTQIALSTTSDSISNRVGTRTINSPVNGTWYDLYFLGVVNSASAYVNAYEIQSSAANVTVGDTLKARNFVFFDLTLLFGPTIADYIYSLETASAGLGVAWFKNMFPKPYYAYDAGSLQSVKTSASKSVGVNQWDEEWESGRYNGTTGATSADTNAIRAINAFRVLPNTEYYGFIGTSGVQLYIGYWNADGSYSGNYARIDNRTFTTPADAYCAKIWTYSGTYGSYANDICINISNPLYNGTYTPHQESVYPIDSSVVIRGIPKLDANNDLYYNGDTYESDGTVTRKYASVDLGGLLWTYSSTNQRFTATLASNATTWVRANAICARYITEVWGNVQSDTSKDKCVFLNGTNVSIRDTAYTDKTTFTTAMNGVYLVYELATPTTESADPYQSPQVVYNGGTEEYVDTREVAMPVYQKATYISAEEGAVDILQNTPSTNGKYILTANVQNGTANYEWDDAAFLSGSFQVSNGDHMYTWNYYKVGKLVNVTGSFGTDMNQDTSTTFIGLPFEAAANTPVHLMDASGTYLVDGLISQSSLTLKFGAMRMTGSESWSNAAATIMYYASNIGCVAFSYIATT